MEIDDSKKRKIDENEPKTINFNIKDYLENQQNFLFGFEMLYHKINELNKRVSQLEKIDTID